SGIEISSQDDFAVVMKHERKTECVGSAEAGSNLSAVAKCCIERAVHTVASQRELARNAFSFVTSADDEFPIGLKHAGTSSRSGIVLAIEMGLYPAAVSETLVKAPVGVKAGERKIVKFAARARAAHSNYNNFAVGLQNDGVPFGLRVAEIENIPAGIAECLVQAAVRIKTRHDEPN